MIAVSMLSLVNILLFYTMTIHNKKVTLMPMQVWPALPFDLFQYHIERAFSKIEGLRYEWNSEMQYWYIEMGTSPLDDAWIAVEDETREWCQIIMHFKDEKEEVEAACLKCLEEGQQCECYKPKARGATIFFDRVIGSESSYHFILCELCSYFDDLLHGPNVMHSTNVMHSPNVMHGTNSPSSHFLHAMNGSAY